MIPYTELDEFTATDIYDVSDLVLGGETGTSNVPLKAILDRTVYLKNRLLRLEGIKEFAGNYSWDIADERMGFVAKLTNNSTFILPDVSAFAVGYILPIRTRYSAVKALTVLASGGQKIDNGFSDVNYMYMHAAETLWLVAAGDHWEVFHAVGNFFSAGEDFRARKIMPNSMVADGTPFNRADMPRLAEFALSLPANQAIVSDATWLSDPGGQPRYRGCYSYGNGSTTLRLPDERGMSEKNLDLGRGIDVTRLHNYPGGLAPGQVGEIGFTVSIPKGDSYNGNPYDTSRVGRGQDSNPRGTINIPITVNSGKKNAVENIGKIPLIRY